MKHLKNWLFVCAGFAVGLLLGGLGGALIERVSNPLAAQIAENQQYLLFRLDHYDMETAASLERLFIALDQIMLAGERMGLSFDEVQAWNRATRLATLRLMDQTRTGALLDNSRQIGDKKYEPKTKKEDP